MTAVSYLAEHNRYCALLGIAIVLLCAWLLSPKKTHIALRPVICGLLLQFLTGFLMLKTIMGSRCIGVVASGAIQVYQYAQSGSTFMFGNLAQADGPWGFIFAVQVLPAIVFFGAFSAFLFYCTVIQKAVKIVNYFLQPLVGTTGPETLCAIANSFLGQTEAPLLIRNYLKNMTTSELFVVMVSGMSTISGAIIVAFVAMGIPASHVLASCVMSVPGSLAMAKLIYPETENSIYTKSQISNGTELYQTGENSRSLFDAIAAGTTDGLQLALNVGAMLIACIGLLAGVNGILSFLSSYLVHLIGSSCEPLSLEKILGMLFMPWGYLLGFTGDYAMRAGELLGIKLVVNELVAYSSLVALHVPERMVILMTYALCGFSNFSCIGIQVGGIGALVPEKRSVIAHLGIYAVFAGALTNIMSAMMVALLL